VSGALLMYALASGELRWRPHDFALRGHYSAGRH